MTIPLFGRYVKGADDSSIEGELIEDLTVDSLDATTVDRLLPTGPENKQVATWDHGTARWEYPQAADFTEVIDRLAPLHALAEIRHSVGAGDNNKFITSDHILPTSGEVNFYVDGDPLIYVLDDTGELYEFSPAAGDIVSNVAQYTSVATFSRTFDTLFKAPGGLTYRAMGTQGNSTHIYHLDPGNNSFSDGGAISGISNVIGAVYHDRDAVLYLLGGSREQLYRLGSHSTAVLVGGQHPSTHSGIVPNTLTLHNGRMYAIANITASNTPVLVEFNKSTGSTTQIGSGFAFGEASSIVGMDSHYTSVTADSPDLYFVLNTGAVYHVAINEAHDATTVTPTATSASVTGKTWVAMASEPSVSGHLTVDAQALRGLSATSAGENPTGGISVYDDTGQFFFGRTGTNRLAFGSAASGLDFNPLKMSVRNFNGGRRVATDLIHTPVAIGWEEYPGIVPLGFDGFAPDDILCFVFTPWAGGTATDAGLDGLNHRRNVQTKWIPMRRLLTSPGGVYIEWFQLLEFGAIANEVPNRNETIDVRVEFRRHSPKEIRFSSYEHQPLSSTDVGLLVVQVVRYR